MRQMLAAYKAIAKGIAPFIILDTFLTRSLFRRFHKVCVTERIKGLFLFLFF